MTWQLLPGLRLARRDPGHLQLGIDPPLVAVLPDRPAVRSLVRTLAHARPLPVLDDELGAALAAIVRAGLAVPAEDAATARGRRRGALVHLDVPPGLLPSALRSVRDSGLHALGPGPDPRPVTVALVWGRGELARERVDGWLRSGTPHLVVRERYDGTWVGPYVVPDRTACLRCVDAHAQESDPRRPVVLDQLARRPGAAPLDELTVVLALAWAVRDVVLHAEGVRPATWSATVDLDTAGGDAVPAPRLWRRHPHCGCAWDSWPARLASA